MEDTNHGWVVRERLIEGMIECGALRFGDFTLTSGKKSNYYVDVKLAVTQPELLRAIAHALAPLSTGCDKIAGVELGAVPIAVAVSMETNIPYIMIRKERKEHGTQRPFEGVLERGEEVLFVEDVVTTGGTLVRAIGSLRSMGAIVSKVACVVDREEGGLEALRYAGVDLHSIVKSRDLLAGASGRV